PTHTIMRKLLFSMLVLFLSASALVAQQGEDALKAAKKAFDKFSLNQDAAALTEASDMLMAAMKDPGVAADPGALVEAGDIYTAMINAYVVARSTGIGEPSDAYKTAAVAGAKAYMKAYEAADPKKGKKYRKASLKGLSEIQGNLSNQGIYAIQDKDYEGSMEAFNTSVMTHKFLVDNGGESALDETKLNDEKYYGALSAVLLDKFAEAKPFFMDLYEAGYEDAGLYDGLYKVSVGMGDKEAAAKYLAEGREKFPDETSLLFTEINYYLSEGRLDELTEKLQEAKDKEPDNVSLYATLGQVYEQLYNKANEAGDAAKATEYFDKAQKEYEAGLAKDPEAARLIYSLGAMIYNRGAAMSQELVELGNDFSKEGQKKYEALKTKVDAEFEKALPYFKKAEMTDPNDLNTLVALKEMFARIDEYETSNEFKARIETIQGGGTVEKSYFKEKGM
ncbi:MAG: hypothetical protein AAFN92_12250, partial [Bacteroidota bacterium]